MDRVLNHRLKKWRQPNSNLVDQEVYLYTQKNKSLLEISKLLNQKYDTVKRNLTYRKVIRKALGREIEEQVAKNLEKSGNIVLRQKGDFPFDFLLNHKKRVDVKSAHKSKDRKYSRYCFQLYDGTAYGRKFQKNISEEVDSLFLVFLDEPNRPIYELSTSQLACKRNLTITEPNKGKYSLRFINFLDN